MTQFDKTRLPSRHVSVGPERAPHRSYYYAMGLSEEDIAKPFVALASAGNNSAPCNTTLNAQADAAQAGVIQGGGMPRRFNTITVTDGIAMGHQGMKASLVSREVIADSVEVSVRGHCYDALVGFAGCDKSLPGMMMAMLRLNIPSIFVYGGSILPGRFHDRDVTVVDVFEVVGKYAAGACPLSEVHELEKVACPGHGACGGQFTANTMACVGEAIGLSLPNSNMVPAPYTTREQIAVAAGAQVMELVARNLRPRDICTREAFINAARVVAATGGSTNAALHLPAMANEAGIDFDLQNVDRGGGERTRYSAGVEFKIPLLESVTATAAARYDRYGSYKADNSGEALDIGSQKETTWNVGLEWRPVESLLVRGSYATSFHAPDMHYLLGQPSSSEVQTYDRLRCIQSGAYLVNNCGVGNTDVWYTFDVNRRGTPLLRSETGDSWTVGFVWDVMPNLSVSADYWAIKLEDMIVDVGADEVLASEAMATYGATFKPSSRPLRVAGSSFSGEKPLSVRPIRANWANNAASAGFTGLSFNAAASSVKKPSESSVCGNAGRVWAAGALPLSGATLNCFCSARIGATSSPCLTCMRPHNQIFPVETSRRLASLGNSPVQPGGTSTNLPARVPVVRRPT